jgi:hypothetical protein
MNDAMSPDLTFWPLLILKMAVTASFVVVATRAAERAGPLVGGMIATLPISAGPAYIFVALQHGDTFVAQSALSSVAVNVVNAVFALTYAALAQRRGLVGSVLPAMALWFALVSVVNAVPWTTVTAVAFNVVGLVICITIGNRFRNVRVPLLPRRWSDLLLRAAMVSVLVATVVTASEAVGAKLTGMLAVFPIVLLSLILILHPRIGGPATAAVLANTLLGLAGFSLCCLTAHLLAVPLGSAAALALALAVSIGCNLVFWRIRRPAAARVPPRV